MVEAGIEGEVEMHGELVGPSANSMLKNSYKSLRDALFYSRTSSIDLIIFWVPSLIPSEGLNLMGALLIF